MNQSERLKEIFIKNENRGIAIAITGSWGVGKTFFWNDFIKEKIKQEKKEREKYYYKATLVDKKAVFDKKYSYVSLFGIETLSDLKTQIYTQLSGHHFSVKEQPKFEVPRWVKAIASGLKEEKVSQLGFSASMRFFDSMLFAQVKDAVICFDDFERMSNRLDIKDVMGLANQLKLEKNCQIILILDEDKAEGENKKKYAEYKEKLIDETIIINSVEPLIRANTLDMDEPLIELMVKFADELEIHNFRFFQKVIKLYKQFLESLDKNVAYSTKEIILVRVVIGYFLELFGQSQNFNWTDIKNDKDKLNNEQQKIYRKLEKISYSAVRVDQLFLEFEKIFQQLEGYNPSILTDIAQTQWLNKENIDKNQNFQTLTDKYYTTNFTKDDLASLIELIVNNVSLFSGNQLEKVIDFLQSENKEKVILLIKEHIKMLCAEGKKTKAQLKDDYGNNFESYIDIIEEKNSVSILDEKACVLNKVIGSGFDKNTSDPTILENFSKADWDNFLGESRSNIFSERYTFDNFNRILRAVRYLFDNQFISEKCLKQIEVHFGAILTDLENEIDEKEPQELRLRFSHWKEKLKLDQS